MLHTDDSSGGEDIHPRSSSVSNEMGIKENKIVDSETTDEPTDGHHDTVETLEAETCPDGHKDTEKGPRDFSILS